MTHNESLTKILLEMEGIIEEPEESIEECAKEIPNIENDFAAALQNPVLNILFQNPSLTGIISDIYAGNDFESAVSRNIKGWKKIKQIDILPIEIADEDTRHKTMAICQNYSNGEIDNELIEIIRKGIEYDSDLEAARNEGYLKGKNERIDIMRAPHIERQNYNRQNINVQFPTYKRRSRWDI